MELRGFDSYPITLGDEMRGERASLGKSLADADRELRIKSRVIAAIENCDLEGFPNRSVVPGYVRSYARYLGMDPDDCYRRFCAESGYQSPAVTIAREVGGMRGRAARVLADAAPGSEIARSRFAAPPARSRYMTRVSLGAITSTAALLALITGISYGGYALLQDIQRVGFAPIPEAPTVVAEAPLIVAPAVDMAAIPLPESSAYQAGGVLAALAAPAPLHPIEAWRRDGPISAIDPRTAGIFAAAPVEAEEISAAERPGTHPAEVDLASVLAREDETAIEIAAAPVRDDEPALEIAAAERAAAGPTARGIALHASEEAWVRVRARDNVIFEGTLAPGERFELPPRADTPVLRAGNAGGIFVLVDGIAYGPVGRRGQIAREVSLQAEDVRGSMPQAKELGLAADATDIHQRADATTPTR